MADGHAEQTHDYHLVDPSPWPLIGGLAAFTMAFGMIVLMKSMNDGEGVFGITGPWIFIAGLAGVLVTMFAWWRDVIDEAEHKGQHTPIVQLHLRYAMILFIASEVMFFVAWFWAYFDVALFPGEVWTDSGGDKLGQVARDSLLGGQFPPVPVTETDANVSGFFKGTFNPWELPLINTLILLLSGVTVTWAHHALVHGDRKGLIWGLVATIVLGMLFTALQAYEYIHALNGNFSYAGHIYGSTFFMATGFHGAHVIIGTIFLSVILFRALSGHFTPKHHFGFEAAAWYWHFVDVVWLFLFAAIYVWGAGTPLTH